MSDEAMLNWLQRYLDEELTEEWYEPAGWFETIYHDNPFPDRLIGMLAKPADILINLRSLVVYIEGRGPLYTWRLEWKRVCDKC